MILTERPVPRQSRFFRGICAATYARETRSAPHGIRLPFSRRSAIRSRRVAPFREDRP